jgi:hypothetical protein
MSGGSLREDGAFAPEFDAAPLVNFARVILSFVEVDVR